MLLPPTNAVIETVPDIPVFISVSFAMTRPIDNLVRICIPMLSFCAKEYAVDSSFSLHREACPYRRCDACIPNDRVFARIPRVSGVA